MILSDLPNFKKWLTQFDEKDKFYAKTLVNSLIFITTDEFINSMMTDLNNYINSKNLKDPIAFYAVRDILRNEEFYFQNNMDKPNKINNNNGVGSPGEVAHFIRDLCKTNVNYYDHPSINSMKVNKIRHIFFINDIGCSGTQIHDFIFFFLKNKTICSWWSKKLITFHVYTHCLSKQGLSKITNNKFINKKNVIYSVHANYGSKDWSAKLTKKMEDFCRSYGDKIDPDTSLGFMDSFGMYVYSHKCPNNVPNIIWETQNNWIPLINQRPNLDFISKISNAFIQLQILYNEFQIKVQKRKYLLSTETKKSLLVLQQIARYRSNKYSIMNYLDLNYFQYDFYLTELRRFHWIDFDNKITKEGKNVLKLIKKQNKTKENVIEEINEFYYPKSLQAPDY